MYAWSFFALNRCASSLNLVYFALVPFQGDLYPNEAMDVIQARLENLDSGYEAKMTENTPVTNTSEKFQGG